MILNYHDRLNQVSIIMKTKKDNDMIDSTDMVNAKNKIELSWPIGLGTVFDKNKIGERGDRLYRFNLRKNKKKTILNSWDLSNWVCLVTK